MGVGCLPPSTTQTNQTCHRRSHRQIALVSPLYVERATSGFSARSLQIQWTLQRTGASLTIWDLTRDQPFVAGARIDPIDFRRPLGNSSRLWSLVSVIRSLAAIPLFVWPTFNVRTMAVTRLRILEWIDRVRPDCVVVTHPWASELIPDLASRRIPTFVDCQNVESDLAHQIARVIRPWTTRLEAKVRAQAIGRIEQRFFPLASEIWLPSMADISRQRAVCRHAIHTRLIPNALDLRQFEMTSFSGGRDIVLPAYFGYEPNVIAARALCDQVFPLVARSMPDVRVILLGRDPDGSAHALERRPSIVATGEVDKTQPYLQRAGVIVAPILQGSGTRYKILEALALGRPVVTTPLGCEGLDVRDGEHLLVRDIDGFAEAIVQLLNDPELGARLGRAGRALVEQRYSWDVVEQAIRSALSVIEVREHGALHHSTPEPQP
jgi:polysaccharide biosynthesis protein PslH